MTRLRAAAATDAGRVRASNQDLALVDGDLVVVADGMGGHAGGEVAAETAVEAFARSFNEDPTATGIVAAATIANREVFERAEREQGLRGMGTTLTAAALLRQPEEVAGQVALINVGDSRAYLLEDGRLTRLTEDHSLVEEMVRHGEITPEAALTHPHRHILTRALGIDLGVEIDSWMLSPPLHSRLMLCSDGLTNECPDEEIAEVLRGVKDPAAAAAELVTRALGHGGNDNITVVVADLDEGDQPETGTDLGGLDAAQQGAPPAPDSAGAHRESRLRSSSAGAQLTAALHGVARGTRRERRRAQRREVIRPAEPMVTVRVALFVLVLLAMLGGIAGFVIWFNRATYYVGLASDHVAIYEGRPGGFLWFKPTLVDESPLPVSSVLPANLPLLQQGVLESSYDDARSVVTNLTNERGLLGFPAVVSTTSTIATLPATSTVAPTTTTTKQPTTTASSTPGGK